MILQNKPNQQRHACIRHIDDGLGRGHRLVEDLEEFDFLSKILVDGLGDGLV